MMDVAQQVVRLLIQRVKEEAGFGRLLLLDPDTALDGTLANSGLELPEDQRQGVIESAQAEAAILEEGFAVTLLVQRVQAEDGFAKVLRINPDGALEETLENGQLFVPTERRTEVIEVAQSRAVAIMGQRAKDRVLQRLASDSFFASQFALDPDAAVASVVAFFQLDLSDGEREGLTDLLLEKELGKDGRFKERLDTLAKARTEWAAFLRKKNSVDAIWLFPSARQPNVSTAFIQRLEGQLTSPPLA